MNSYKSVFLKPGKEKAILNRHPWVFSGAIHKLDDSIAAGDVVMIKDKAGHDLAIGHWCGDDSLVCRIFSFDPKKDIEELFLERLKKASILRKNFNLPSASTTGFRLIHGEGDGLSGLVCDIYGDTTSIQLSNPGLRPFIPKLCEFLGKKNVWLSDSFRNESSWLLGKDESALFLENGLKFLARVSDGQKTGHFLDQRDNRQLVKSLSRGRDVLDAFCHSGGFSTYALLGQARSVVSVDISEQALALCKEHVALNELHAQHEAIKADCFSYLRCLEADRFNLIVLDPPAFAKSAHAVDKAARGYKDINLQALKAIRKDGLLFTYSCSQHISHDLFKKIIFAAAKDSGKEVKIIKELTQSSCHPVSVYCPQSSYLKGLLLYVE
jgi:23S rRNA (cytosine1962-C5)-methyltransferase